jgi:hypothetical protein
MTEWLYKSPHCLYNIQRGNQKRPNLYWVGQQRTKASHKVSPQITTKAKKEDKSETNNAHQLVAEE